MKQKRRALKTKTKPLNNQLRRYRLKRNLSQRLVASLIGHRHAGRVSAWEAGRQTPNLQSALKLSAAIKCPVEVLFFPMYDQLRQEVAARRKKLQPGSGAGLQSDVQTKKE